MIDQGTFEVITFIFVMIGGVILLFLRGTQAYKIRIRRDFRNLSRPPLIRWAYFDKRAKVVNFYRFKLLPMVFLEKTQSYFDPNAFSFKREIDMYIGVSGKPDDDNLVPIGQTILSGASANVVSDKILDGLISLIPQEVKDKSLYKKLEGAITRDWLMKVIGVVDVKDVNVLMQNQKIQVADLHSRTNEFIDRHLSWVAKFGPIIGISMMFLVICIGAVVLYQGEQQYYAHSIQTNDNLAAEIGQYFTTHNSVSGGTVPVPTTTVVPVSNGTVKVT
jgi:hypothetical protein